MWEIWQQSLSLSKQLSGGYGSLMDIGCGAGQFLEFSKRIGWKDLVGIEWNPEVAKRAEEVSGAKVYTSDILKVSLPAQSFNVITLWDVIEHLNDVHSVLKETFRLLKPGGILLVGTPHCRGLTMRFLREKALVVNPPEHLILFSKIGMLKSLESAGFEVKKHWSFSIYLREWMNLLSNVRTTQNIEDKNYIRYRSKMTQSKAFLTLMSATNYFLKITNLGDQLIAIAQKPPS
jgi:2-polyprenyl-3-methyl-5-hydroxy-6-metoxy-1,4-benzoquinol methylase